MGRDDPLNSIEDNVTNMRKLFIATLRFRGPCAHRRFTYVYCKTSKKKFGTPAPGPCGQFAFWKRFQIFFDNSLAPQTCESPSWKTQKMSIIWNWNCERPCAKKRPKSTVCFHMWTHEDFTCYLVFVYCNTWYLLFCNGNLHMCIHANVPTHDTLCSPKKLNYENPVFSPWRRWLGHTLYAYKLSFDMKR